MKQIVMMLCACLMVGGIDAAAAKPKKELKPAQTILLYPEGQAAGKGLPEAEGPIVSNGYTADKEVRAENGNLTCTGDNARMEIYTPKKPNGQMVIVCPGGGYWKVASTLEGLHVAEWMVERGITVCVLIYRVAETKWKIPLQDVQNAFRYCRAHASEWGVNQIGVMGFSAGGHLAACASNLYVDEITRPDFSVLIYPVTSFDRKYAKNGTRDKLIGKLGEWESKEGRTMKEWEAAQTQVNELIAAYSMENHITSKTPTAFLACSKDDKSVPVEHSLTYYSKLVENGVSAELHIYPSGGHGWGFGYERFNPKGKDKFAYARSEFEASLERWLEGIRK